MNFLRNSPGYRPETDHSRREEGRSAAEKWRGGPNRSEQPRCLARAGALAGQAGSLFHLSGRAAFSLLEVMVAIAIFFTAAFAILTVVAGSLRNAHLLQRPQVDAAAVASALSITNKIVEGTSSGDLSELLGDTYRGYTWESTAVEVQSNKLFQVDFVIYSPDQGHPVFSKISTRLFRPESPPGSLDGGGMGLH